MQKRRQPFDHFPRTPDGHFRLYFFAAVSHLLRQLAETLGSREETIKQFPFLLGYENELLVHEPDNLNANGAAKWWQTALSTWEATAEEHLPLRSLRQSCDLDHDAMTLLLGIGLVDEDARFGFLFESIHSTPGQLRPTIGLCNALWRDARATLQRLNEFGLIQFVATENPRAQWASEVPALLSDAMRGTVAQDLAPWASYRTRDTLCPFERVVLPPELRLRLTTLLSLLKSGETRTVVVRGPQRNGRRTLLGALARELGQGLFEVNGFDQPGDDRWSLLGPMATALNALPVITFDLSPSETRHLPPLNGHQGALGIVLGKHGGVSGRDTESAITLQLEVPDGDARSELWQRELGNISSLKDISEGFRLTTGNISRAAKLASASASLNSRAQVTLSDVQQSIRALNQQALDTLATHIPVAGDWSCLAVKTEALQELLTLETRCRHRERLQISASGLLGSEANAGVRALFSGASGTGKTLAARVLASVLQKDLYRIDLSTVVNKYIGETEKNLDRVFSRAEELDVILLLDEGDALLTQRTDVHTANDRYANLETNFLLQRLESFDGILIITTNAGDRIDRAFQRRMDVVISFLPPDAMLRWGIWQLHLPLRNAVDLSMLEEVAGRCALTGGQIRNAAQHASLLALQDGGVVTTQQLEAAIQREYRKAGAVCPLREMTAVASYWG
jgi:hypothetical protein